MSRERARGRPGPAVPASEAGPGPGTREGPAGACPPRARPSPANGEGALRGRSQWARGAGPGAGRGRGGDGGGAAVLRGAGAGRGRRRWRWRRQRAGAQPPPRAGALPRRRLRPVPACRPRRLGAALRAAALRAAAVPAAQRGAARRGRRAAGARGAAAGAGAVRAVPAGAGARARAGGALAVRGRGGGGGHGPAGAVLVRLAAGARAGRGRGRLGGAGQRRLPAQGAGAAGLRVPVRRPVPRALPQHAEPRRGQQPGGRGERAGAHRCPLLARHRGRRRLRALARRAPRRGRDRRLAVLEGRRVGRAHAALLPRRHPALQRRCPGRGRGCGAARARLGGRGAGERRAGPAGLDGAGGVRGHLGLRGAAGTEAAPHLPARGGGQSPAPSDTGGRRRAGCRRRALGPCGVRHRGVVPLRRGRGGAGGERARLCPAVPGQHLPPRGRGDRAGLRGAGAGVRPLGDRGDPLGRAGGGRAPRHAANHLCRARRLQRRPPRVLRQREPHGHRGQQHAGHGCGGHLPAPQLLHPHHGPAAARGAISPHPRPRRLRGAQPGGGQRQSGLAAPAAARAPQQALSPLPGNLWQGPRCRGWRCHPLCSPGAVGPRRLHCTEPVGHGHPGAGDMAQCLGQLLTAPGGEVWGLYDCFIFSPGP